jgi:hypothetical protein
MTYAAPFLCFKSDAKDAPAYWLLDGLWIVHVTGEQTGGDTGCWRSGNVAKVPGQALVVE